MITLLLLACLSPELITSAVDCDRSSDVDCDGIIGLWDCDDTDPDIGVPDRYYPDEDMDGYGVWDGAIGACEHPGDGWVDCLGLTWDLEPCPEMDCDDTDPDIGPDCPP
tara:strand:- start:243 stop:569 length:327 start_codon:yes stop_codon:yes gene_type:complete